MPNVIDFADESLEDLSVAIVVSKYNQHITQSLQDAAVETFLAAGIRDEDIHIAVVPGAWELTLGAARLADTTLFSGIVVLGAVIQGDTSHDLHINRAVSTSLMEIGIDSGLPIGFGLLTCNNVEQALERCGGSMGNKGNEAALAVLEMIRLNQAVSDLYPDPFAESLNGPEPV